MKTFQQFLGTLSEASNIDYVAFMDKIVDKNGGEHQYMANDLSKKSIKFLQQCCEYLVDNHPTYNYLKKYLPKLYTMSKEELIDAILE